VVPVGPGGCRRSRWALGSQWWSSLEQRGQRISLEYGSLLVLVQLVHLQAEVVDGAVDVGPPGLERPRDALKFGDAGVVGDGEIRETALPLVVVVVESLLPTRVPLVQPLG